MTQQLTERHPGVYAERTPERPAIIVDDGSAPITFSAYESLSNQFAHLLRKLGLEVGERVALFLHNHRLYLPLAWGGMRAGLRVTAIPTHLGAEEVDYILSDSGAKVLVTSYRYADVAEMLRATSVLAGGRFMVDGVLAGFQSLEDSIEEFSTSPINDQCEGVEMFYSSGTTGRPKGIMKPLTGNPFGMPSEWHRFMMDLYGVDEGTVYLSPAPLYHAAPLMFNLRVNRFGGTSVIMPRFDAAQSLRLIEQYSVTHSQWVPTMFVRMLRLSEAQRSEFDLGSHRVAIHAAAPCPVQIKHQMMDWWGPILHEYYAGSEGNGYVYASPSDWLERPGTVGRPLIGELKICDADGTPVSSNEVGTIFFANGPTFEYHNDDEKTAQSRHAAGWSTLGDVGYVDNDGYLFLTDRRAFTIISGGVNVYPQEAENILVSHPKVADVAVIGVPNLEFGEEVKAIVQPLRFEEAGPELEAVLLDYCRQHLSRVKSPKSVDFLETLPREANGKLYKRKLWEQYRSRTVS